MPSADALVSICLPVYNGAERLEGAVRSALSQDHERIELVISDNASSDGTEELCRELARSDPRVLYLRQPYNVGLLNNFRAAARTATGEYFRWLGDDDRLERNCVSRALEPFLDDERLVLVTTQVAYLGPSGVAKSQPYRGHGLDSGDPLERFAEMLRLLNESHLEIDPLYGLMRRRTVVAMERRNMLHEDEVFAARLALAGPWAHVPEVLAQRCWKADRKTSLARRLGVPAWQAHASNTLQCAELFRWVARSELAAEQKVRARALVMRMYLMRQRRTVGHRGAKLARLAFGPTSR